MAGRLRCSIVRYWHRVHLRLCGSAVFDPYCGWASEFLHHQKDGWNPMNNGMFTIYQLVQDFATIHSITRFVHVLYGVHQYSMHLLVTKLRPRINPCQDGSVSKQETPTSPTVTRINYPIVTFPLGGMPTFSHAHVTCWELYRLVHAHDYYSICSYHTICSFPWTISPGINLYKYNLQPELHEGLPPICHGMNLTAQSYWDVHPG